MVKQSTPIAGRLVHVSKHDFDNTAVMSTHWEAFLDKLGIPDDPDSIVSDVVTLTVIRCHYDINSTKEQSHEYTDQPPRSIMKMKDLP